LNGLRNASAPVNGPISGTCAFVKTGIAAIVVGVPT
jgi:hypothetical protein